MLHFLIFNKEGGEHYTLSPLGYINTIYLCAASSHAAALLAIWCRQMAFVPTAHEIKVLRVLANANHSMIGVELEAATQLSRRTIVDCLARLKGAGFVHCPNGERQGVAITPDGRLHTAPR